MTAATAREDKHEVGRRRGSRRQRCGSSTCQPRTGSVRPGRRSHVVPVVKPSRPGGIINESVLLRARTLGGTQAEFVAPARVLVAAITGGAGGVETSRAFRPAPMRPGTYCPVLAYPSVTRIVSAIAGPFAIQSGGDVC